MHELITHKRSRLKYLVVLILTLVITVQAHILTAYATPPAPVLLVNHSLKQCIEKVYLSDECSYCQVINGWEISPTGQCPVGYQIVQYQYQVADKNRPVDCVEGPRNEWLACSWGKYPTVTPFLSVTPTPSNVNEPSDHFLLILILCISALVSIFIISFVILRKKKPF
jgi:hypothetical protein